MRRGVQKAGLVGVLAGLVVGVLGFVAQPVAAPASTSVQQTPATEIRVAIKPLEPFVTKATDGSYAGFSIELWNEIAKRNGWKTNFV